MDRDLKAEELRLAPVPHDPVHRWVTLSSIGVSGPAVHRAAAAGPAAGSALSIRPRTSRLPLFFRGGFLQEQQPERLAQGAQLAAVPAGKALQDRLPFLREAHAHLAAIAGIG